MINRHVLIEKGLDERQQLFTHMSYNMNPPVEANTQMAILSLFQSYWKHEITKARLLALLGTGADHYFEEYL